MAGSDGKQVQAPKMDARRFPARFSCAHRSRLRNIPHRTWLCPNWKPTTRQRFCVIHQIEKRRGDKEERENRKWRPRRLVMVFEVCSPDTGERNFDRSYEFRRSIAIEEGRNSAQGQKRSCELFPHLFRSGFSTIEPSESEIHSHVKLESSFLSDCSIRA